MALQAVNALHEPAAQTDVEGRRLWPRLLAVGHEQCVLVTEPHVGALEGPEGGCVGCNHLVCCFAAAIQTIHGTKLRLACIPRHSTAVLNNMTSSDHLHPSAYATCAGGMTYARLCELVAGIRYLHKVVGYAYRDLEDKHVGLADGRLCVFDMSTCVPLDERDGYAGALLLPHESEDEGIAVCGCDCVRQVGL